MLFYVDIKSIGLAVLVVMLLAIVLGTGLIFADNKFSIKKDPKQIELEEKILPGYNCGACGFPSCGGYADSIMKGNKDFTKCRPGGPGTVTKITKLMTK